jgi:tetratricopeptide (TPR) repeat protein
MTKRIFIPIALLLVGISGCTKNTPSSRTTPSPSVTVNETPVKDQPINSETHFAAGQLAESRGQSDIAVQQYSNALKLNKQHIASLYRLGCVYASQKKYTESVAIWRRYITATDGSATGYSNLAYTEELAGNPVGAEADYKKGVAKDPTNEPCRVNYGLMLARHGRIGEATIQLQAVLSPAEVHYNLATVYELEQRKEMAKLEYQEAVASDPNFAEARNKLASLGDVNARE